MLYIAVGMLWICLSQR